MEIEWYSKSKQRDSKTCFSKQDLGPYFRNRGWKRSIFFSSLKMLLGWIKKKETDANIGFECKYLSGELGRIKAEGWCKLLQNELLAPSKKTRSSDTMLKWAYRAGHLNFS